MKLYVYHWMQKELSIPGVYQEGKAEEGYRTPHWLDVPDENLGKILLDLAKDNDVMLLGPSDGLDNYRLYLDMKGKRFRQR